MPSGGKGKNLEKGVKRNLAEILRKSGISQSEERENVYKTPTKGKRPFEYSVQSDGRRKSVNYPSVEKGEMNV